jgi:hypothetical protein
LQTPCRQHVATLPNAEIFTVFFGAIWFNESCLEKIKALQTESPFWDGCMVRQRLPGHSCLSVLRQRAIISRSTTCNPFKTLFLGLFHAGMATAKSRNGLLL